MGRFEDIKVRDAIPELQKDDMFLTWAESDRRWLIEQVERLRKALAWAKAKHPEDHEPDKGWSCVICATLAALEANDA